MRRREDKEAAGREVVELAALADGSLPPEQRLALEERVAASPELAELLAEQRSVVTLARGAAAEVEAPPGLRARIDAQQAGRRKPVAYRLALVGAAAVAVAAVAFAVAGTGTSTQRFEASLAPTGLTPGARGDATLTKTSSGWRIELDATGLPRLDSGRFYEAWLRNRAGILVPIGTFNEGRNVTLWAGVSPVDFPMLSVTRERADGNQASSGEKVLVGAVDTGG